ncbi:MAG: FAD-dependent oxidoreductase [Xenococcaceae cyanobacterium]
MNPLEATVARVGDLQNGQMRQVKVGDTDVLLVKINNQFHATGAYCTHYQAPLAKGVLSGDRVVCPWHNACFNTVTGEQLEPPGLGALSCYQVRIEDDNVIVSIAEDEATMRSTLKQMTKLPPMAKYDPSLDGRTFVILGAGAAGAHAAETLRIAGYQGRIVMVTQDDRLPYDRTWLSKDYFLDKVSQEDMPLRSADFYPEHDIEVLLNKQVVKVEAVAKTIIFADGETIKYNSLLVATGGKARQLDVPGKELKNIFTLRSFSDTDRIKAAAKTRSRAVVIGSSFIGMEAASALTQQGLTVTVVSPDALPFKKILGEEIGQIFQQVHQENGVSFRLERKVIRFEGSDKVEAVILDNDERIETDLVVVGIGVQPATEFLEGVGLDPKDLSVPVNKHLEAADSLYAAGDIARYPDWITGKMIRIEHWRIAAQHGRIAAYNMAGKACQFKGVPVFWTMQFKFPLRYVGHAEEWDEIIVNGDLHQREFIAFYVKGDRVLAAASSKRDTETAAIYELMRQGSVPSPEVLRNNSLDLVSMLRSS